MFHIRSSLGSFLSGNREDWQRGNQGAAMFATAAGADDWIVANYGRNGLSFFYPAHVKDRDDEDD